MIERRHATTALLALVVTTALAASAAATAPAPMAADASSAVAQSTDDTPSLQQGNETIRIGSSAVKPGENVTVTLATNAEDVAGYQASITFDQSVVKVQSVSGTSDFDGPAVNVNNEKGTLFVTQSSPDGGDSPALARITFYAVGDTNERTKLAFVEDETYVNDADAENVNVSTSPGSLQVTDGEFVALDDETTAENGTDTSSGAGVLGGVSPEILGGVALFVGAIALGVLLGRRS